MLTYEERLTYPHASGERKKTKLGYTRYWTKAGKGALMERLGEYEDIGLTPTEVRNMYDGIRKLRGDYESAGGGINGQVPHQG